MINTIIKISLIGFSFLMTSCEVKEQTIESQRNQNNNSSQQSATEQNSNLRGYSNENINNKDVDDYGLKPEQLPSIVRAELDKRFSGWRFPKVDESIHRYLREINSADIHPEFISGDFDGNGQLDYAVRIEHGVALGEDGDPVGHNTYVVAFLKNRDKLKFYMLEHGMANDGMVDYEGEIITLIKKGEKGYEYGTGKNFIYKNDTIFSGYFEKGGSSYIYEKGKFRGITTSD